MKRSRSSPRNPPSAVMVVLLGAAVAAQVSSKPTVREHVDIEAGLDKSRVDPGETVRLMVKVSPRPNIRVFAPGAKDLTAIMLAVTPPAGIKLGKASFPAPRLERVKSIGRRVPVYGDAFTVAQDLVIARDMKRGQEVTILGSLIYQSCDDRETFARSSIPIVWTLRIRDEGAE